MAEDYRWQLIFGPNRLMAQEGLVFDLEDQALELGLPIVRREVPPR